MMGSPATSWRVECQWPMGSLRFSNTIQIPFSADGLYYMVDSLRLFYFRPLTAHTSVNHPHLPTHLLSYSSSSMVYQVPLLQNALLFAFVVVCIFLPLERALAGLRKHCLSSQLPFSANVLLHIDFSSKLLISFLRNTTYFSSISRPPAYCKALIPAVQ